MQSGADSYTVRIVRVVWSANSRASRTCC